MSEWSEGYVNDIGYTYGYYGDLNPNSFTIPFLMAGIVAPKVLKACELGFGQGLSLNAHACASDVEWYGTDFSPAQVGFAKEMAEASGSKVELFDEAFSEFCERDDLPSFDFIGLHGIWSWISAENRHFIVDFVNKNLKVGGVLYISYNTLPGWSQVAPLRHMMAEHAHTMGVKGEGSVKRTGDSVQFTKDLVSLCHKYQQDVPSIGARMDSIGEQNPHYLAHEYFNRDWHPMYFTEMAEWLTSAKLDYACTTNFLGDFNVVKFSKDQSEFLSTITDPIFAEGVKDFMLNTQFRKDYWVKGARRLNAQEFEKKWLSLSFVMSCQKEDIELKVAGNAGDATLNDNIYQPIIEFLSDRNIYTVDAIQAFLRGHNISNDQLFQALAILHSKGDIHLVQSDATVKAVRQRCHQLNDHILEASLVNSDVGYLISPLTGGAIAFNRIEQMFLYSFIQGNADKAAWVNAASVALKKAGHKLFSENKEFITDEENFKELQRLADLFEKGNLLTAKTLQLIAEK